MGMGKEVGENVRKRVGTISIFVRQIRSELAYGSRYYEYK